MPLTAAECKLMRPELVEAYRKVEEQLAQVLRLPSLAKDAAVKAVCDEMDRIGKIMRRDRYRVGFLGRSQIGKSTTVNTVLDYPVCVEGSASATTSSVTRVHTSAGAAPTCRLHFMTRRDFQERRKDLCELLGLSAFAVAPNKDHDELRRENDQLIREIADLREKQKRPGPGGRAAAPDTDKEADLKYFERLLRSFNQFGAQQVGEAAVVSDQPFDQRNSFTSHLAGDAATPYLLLREVELGLPLELLGENLEVIDLPGLGARLAADDKLTEAYLKELDGALIFQSSEQVAAKEAYRLLTKLLNQFDGMAGRVWMVVTKMDGLTPAKLYGDDANKRTLLDNLAQTLGDNGIPHEQTLMVSNLFYKRLAESDGPIDAARYKDILGVDVADGKPVMPKEFDRVPHLRDAFAEVLKDGGIGKVREVIRHDLERMVRQRVQEDVRAGLRRVSSELGRVVTFAKERAKLNHDDFINAMEWVNRVSETADELARGRTVEAPARELKARLHELFNRLCSPTASKQEDLPRRHEAYARALRDETRRRAFTETLPKFQTAARQVLEGHVRKAPLRAVSLPQRGTVPEALAALFTDDLQARDWYETQLELFSVPLYPADKRPYLPPDAYREIMGDKIDAVVYQLADTMEQRVIGHLRALERDLEQLGSNEANVDRNGSAAYDQILTGLRGAIHGA